MRTECALLCDAASVREGLLHILGGGVNALAVRDFPAALPITFALRVVLEERESMASHAVTLELLDADVRSVGRVEISFDVRRAQREGEAALAVPVPLGGLHVGAPGVYTIRASLDARSLGTFPLRINRAAEGTAGEVLRD